MVISSLEILASLCCGCYYSFSEAEGLHPTPQAAGGLVPLLVAQGTSDAHLQGADVACGRARRGADAGRTPQGSARPEGPQLPVLPSRRQYRGGRKQGMVG